jgi:hypothetical protein
LLKKFLRLKKKIPKTNTIANTTTKITSSSAGATTTRACDKHTESTGEITNAKEKPLWEA